MRISGLLLASVLGACATVDVTASKPQSDVRQIHDTNYTLGVERSVVVGNPIVRVRDYLETTTERPAMQPTESFQLSGGLVTISFGQGERLPIHGERVVDSTTYTVARKGEYGIQIAPDGTIGAGVINGLGSDVQVVMAYQFSASSPTARFERVVDRQVQRNPTGQNFEIVFNGIDANAMRFQYREYTASDLARPAFFQELSYPLTTPTIRFRDLEISVVTVDAQQLSYVVVAD
jgi:hypothetical protein